MHATGLRLLSQSRLRGRVNAYAAVPGTGAGDGSRTRDIQLGRLNVLD
jgi:hypothetical protein